MAAGGHRGGTTPQKSAVPPTKPVVPEKKK